MDRRFNKILSFLKKWLKLKKKLRLLPDSNYAAKRSFHWSRRQRSLEMRVQDRRFDTNKSKSIKYLSILFFRRNWPRFHKVTTRYESFSCKTVLVTHSSYYFRIYRLCKLRLTEVEMKAHIYINRASMWLRCHLTHQLRELVYESMTSSCSAMDTT